MPSDAEFEQFVEARARAWGLPVIPPEYREEGIALAASAPNADEADSLIGLLQKDGIPGWPIRPLNYPGNSEITLGIPEGQVGVFVPAGRLKAAQALVARSAAEIAEFRRSRERFEQEMEAQAAARREADAADPQRGDPEAAETPEETALREELSRQTSRMMLLTLILIPVAPAVLAWNWSLLRRIRREQQRPDMRDAFKGSEGMALLNLIMSLTTSLLWLLVVWNILSRIAR